MLWLVSWLWVGILIICEEKMKIEKEKKKSKSTGVASSADRHGQDGPALLAFVWQPEEGR